MFNLFLIESEFQDVHKKSLSSFWLKNKIRWINIFWTKYLQKKKKNSKKYDEKKHLIFKFHLYEFYGTSRHV